MEERRLKNLISHLSLCSDCPLENSAVLSVLNKAGNMERMKKSGLAIPDITQRNPQLSFEEQKAFRFMSKSRPTSNIFESRQSRSVEENFMSGARSYPTTLSSSGADAQLKAASQCKETDFLSASSKGMARDPSPKERPIHSFTPHSEATTHKCECLLRSKNLSSEVEGQSACLHMNYQGVNLRTSAQGYRLYNTGQTVSQSTQMQNNCATQFEHACISSDAKLYDLEAQCKSFNSGKVLVEGFQGGEDHHRLCMADDREALRAQIPRESDSELRAKYNLDTDVAAEQQTNIKALSAQRSSLERNLMTCTDVLDSQPVNAAMDTSGSTTLSRNNAVTGQRRHIVEDCIFCLIIQGQSPAFKLYEDEMCVCILDVHPLAHGHSLLIPKAHFPSLEFTPPEVAAAMCATVPLISMAIMQATNCDSFNLLVNSGKAAGQVVLHTHFHIIPRRSGDNLWRSEDDSRRALPVGNETALLVQQIRHNLSNKFL